MAAIDEKLRLAIVTALDNAGIKATQDQIDGLATKLKKVNEEGKTEKLESALGKLPGKLGGVSKALGGIVGKLGLVAGAFTTGYEIGTIFVEKIQKGLFGWKDPIEKLIDANKKLKKWQEEEVEAWNRKSLGIQKHYEREQAALDKTIAKINAQSQAYQRLAKSASEFFTAGEDKDIQQLERERFEDVMRLQSMGEYDAADQANKVYDVLWQEMEAKKQILAYDDESDMKEAEYLKKREKIIPLLEKEKKLIEEAWKLHSWKDDLDAGLSNKEIDKNQTQINARLKQIERERAQLEKEANSLADDLDAYDVESQTRELKRATLVDRLFLEGDKAAAEYDRAVSANGNLLGINFTKDFVEKYNQASIDSYNELKSIELNTQGLRDLTDKLDALLQLKQ